MVMVLAAQEAVTPPGKPLAAPIPVAPVVVCVMEVITVLIQGVGLEEAAETVLFGLTVMVPVVETVPQPPVSVTV